MPFNLNSRRIAADDLESELAQIAESARQASSATRLLIDQPDDSVL
jgi:hypothetical protein